jgi:hypothetical protein
MYQHVALRCFYIKTLIEGGREMPQETLKPGLRAALRVHEIGEASPYEISFAGKGKSGASFGFMQGDLAAGQPKVTQTFRQALTNAGIGAAMIGDFESRLSVHLVSNPLTTAETAQINAALVAGKALVDAMDEDILGKVYAGLDSCVATAAASARTISAEAQIYMALWINMTGPPSKVLDWLGGGDPHLTRPVPGPGTNVSAGAIRTYLQATDYFVRNPRNFMHMVESVAAGMAAMSGTASPIAPAPAPAPATAAAAPTEDCFVYEQATGRMFLVEDGSRDLIATGYSGSEEHGGKNNPHAQCEKDIGPLCRGRYSIGAPFAGPSPFSLRLTPDPANEMCGRGSFLIHGDSIAHPGTASHGCIILNRPNREQINGSDVKLLVVVDRLA